MSSDALTVVTRHRQVGIAVIVAALFIVPPFVRATFPIGSSSSPIRLTRGFETPPSKADVPSLEQVAGVISLRAPEDPRAAHCSPDLTESKIASQADRAPDLERGPPAIRF
jgi:hypothetical protein